MSNRKDRKSEIRQRRQRRKKRLKQRKNQLIMEAEVKRDRKIDRAEAE